MTAELTVAWCQVGGVACNVAPIEHRVEHDEQVSTFASGIASSTFRDKDGVFSRSVVSEHLHMIARKSLPFRSTEEQIEYANEARAGSPPSEDR